MRVRVDQARQRRLARQPARRSQIRRLPREPGDPALGVGKERETGFESLPRINAVRQPAGSRRRDRHARSRRYHTGITVGLRFLVHPAGMQKSGGIPQRANRKAATGALWSAGWKYPHQPQPAAAGVGRPLPLGPVAGSHSRQPDNQTRQLRLFVDPGAPIPPNLSLL